MRLLLKELYARSRDELSGIQSGLAGLALLAVIVARSLWEPVVERPPRPPELRGKWLL